ncbi:hypothetical protein JYT57_00865, partial [Nitrosarchaeum koreense]|nr:hypothetical protein [Nitrosarchaeum koreense]
KELETIVANYYLDIPNTESDYIACTAQWDPVCGINAITYGNDCEAYVAGVEISSLGECTVGNSDGCPENYPYIWSNGQCYSQPDSNLLSNDCPDDYPYEHSNGDCYGYQESGTGPSFYANGCPEGYPFLNLWNGDCTTTPDPDVNIIPYFDSDGDGVPDSEDSCPELYGLMFPAGCPDVPLSPSDPTPITTKSSENETSSDGGGCLIATATYGSEMAPQVQQLRELRDNSLLQSESGINFMNTFNDVYYSFSPYIADYERENPAFKEMVKITITPLITSLSILNYVDMNSEESVLGYWVSLIVLNLAMYVGIPVVAIVGIRKYV